MVSKKGSWDSHRRCPRLIWRIADGAGSQLEEASYGEDFMAKNMPSAVALKRKCRSIAGRRRWVRK
jgi:hypothetical protein